MFVSFIYSIWSCAKSKARSFEVVLFLLEELFYFFLHFACDDYGNMLFLLDSTSAGSVGERVKAREFLSILHD